MSAHPLARCLPSNRDGGHPTPLLCSVSVGPLTARNFLDRMHRSAIWLEEGHTLHSGSGNFGFMQMNLEKGRKKKNRLATNDESFLPCLPDLLNSPVHFFSSFCDNTPSWATRCKRKKKKEAHGRCRKSTLCISWHGEDFVQQILLHMVCGQKKRCCLVAPVRCVVCSTRSYDNIKASNQRRRN